MLGKTWRQEFEMDGHIASTLRKQREMDAGFPFFKCGPGPQPMEVPSIFRCLPTLTNSV